MWLIIYVTGALIKYCWLYIGDILLGFFSGTADYLANAEVKLPNHRTDNGQTNLNGR